MATVLPKTKLARIQWCEDRIDAWKASPTTLGLTLSECNDLQDLIAAARAGYEDQQKAKNAVKDATLISDSTAAQMTEAAANAVRHIKAYAASSADPAAVYAAASVPMPAAPGVLQPPAQPTDFTFTLDTNTGGLIIRWKCTNPAGVSGVVYNVRRAVGSGPLTTIGVTGEKKFIDTTITTASSITYQVFGQRGGVVGTASNPVTVHFGVGGGGNGVMRVVEQTPQAGGELKAA